MTYHLCNSKARFDREFCVGGRNRREFLSQYLGRGAQQSVEFWELRRDYHSLMMSVMNVMCFRAPNPKLQRCIQFESQHDVGGSISHGQPMQKPQQVTGWGTFMLTS